jgi:hypothetical protein
VLVHPLLRTDRLRSWRSSLSKGSPELRDRLAIEPRGTFGRVAWRDLEQVANFLRQHGVRDGELFCVSETASPLYLTLDLDPPVRYLQFYAVTTTFMNHHHAILDELNAQHLRFVVGDIVATGADPDAPIADIPAKWRDLYPWNRPLLYRAGQYLVYEGRGSAGRFWP